MSAHPLPFGLSLIKFQDSEKNSDNYIFSVLSRVSHRYFRIVVKIRHGDMCGVKPIGQYAEDIYKYPYKS